ncbi:hypothetical protein BC834DRAFT_253344 [Gloeopeniophorella convolvens]|nr:hypothetical protein BC834DRAFT_253344 [Gloeopeniophorella convolvens]
MLPERPLRSTPPPQAVAAPSCSSPTRPPNVASPSRRDVTPTSDRCDAAVCYPVRYRSAYVPSVPALPVRVSDSQRVAAITSHLPSFAPLRVSSPYDAGLQGGALQPFKRRVDKARSHKSHWPPLQGISSPQQKECV